MMVVLCILSAVMGLTGIKVSQFLKEQHFLSDAQIVLNQLQAAQDFMLVLDADIKLKFEQGEQGIIHKISLDKNLTPGWKKIVERPTRPLRYIKKMTFKGPEVDQDTTSEPIELQFLSGGVLMDKGTLTLIGDTKEDPDKAGPYVRKIILRGYPMPFESSMDESNYPSAYEESHDDDIFRAAMKELLGKEK